MAETKVETSVNAMAAMTVVKWDKLQEGQKVVTKVAKKVEHLDIEKAEQKAEKTVEMKAASQVGLFAIRMGQEESKV